MRKLLFCGLVLALLVTTVGVVYAGYTWDDDPHIGEGVWLATKTVTTDEPPDGWTPDVGYKAEVKKKDDGKIEAKAEVWTREYPVKGKCTMTAYLTLGENGRLLASRSDKCGAKFDVQWKGYLP